MNSLETFKLNVVVEIFKNGARRLKQKLIKMNAFIPSHPLIFIVR